MNNLKPEVTIEDFAKLDIRTAKVKDVGEVSESEKLIKLTLDVGEGEERTIFAGIKKWYGAEDLKGKDIVFLANLKPRKMMNEDSQGMLLAVDSSEEEKPALLIPEGATNPGDPVR